MGADQAADCVGQPDIDVHGRGLPAAVGQPMAVSHADGDILMGRRHDAGQILRAAGGGMGFDQRREVAAGVDENVIDAAEAEGAE